MKVQHFAEVKIGLFTRIGFLFDMYALIESWSETDKSGENFLYHAYRSYCKEKGKRVKLSNEKFGKLMNKVTVSEMKNLTNVMKESIKDIQIIKETVQSELKKKSV